MSGEIAATDRVRVAVRIRPFNKADHDTKDIAVSFDPRTQTVKANRGNSTKSLAFDYIFHPESAQEDVFSAIGEPMLRDVFEGFHATCFAYGQTGSGKTFSMMGGGPGLEGIIPRISMALFDKINEVKRQHPDVAVVAQMSFLELYNENIYDLLAKDTPSKGAKEAKGALNPLQLKETRDKTWKVNGLRQLPVSSGADIAKYITLGNSYRHVAETGMNDFSSRSHAIVTLSITQECNPPRIDYRDRHANINLIDLAGSECLSKTQNEGQAAAEATHINRSLLTLCKCLRAASDPKATHVPVRDSVLTKMLAPVFGGNARTFMLACVSPSTFNVVESLNTLTMAYESKKIKNKAKANFDGEAMEREALMAEHARLLQQQISMEEEAFAKRRELKAKIAATKKERDEAKAQAEGMAGGGGGNAQNRLAELRAEYDSLLEQNEKLQSLRGEWIARAERQRARRERLAARQQMGSAGPDAVAPMQSEPAFGRGAHAGATHGMDGGPRGMPAGGGQLGYGSRPGPEPELLPPRVLGGAQGQVYGVAFSRDGKRVISVSQDTHVRVYEPFANSEALRCVGIKMHKHAVLAVAVSPDGDTFATGGHDKTVYVYSGLSNGQYKVIKPYKMKAYINAIVFHSDKDKIVVALSDHTVKLVYLRDGRMESLKGHEDEVTDVSFSPNGGFVATSSKDGTVKIWNLKTLQQQDSFSGHKGIVWGVAFHPQGWKVVSVGQDTTMRIWQTYPREDQPITVQGHTSDVMKVVLVRNGDLALTASRDRTCKIWNLADGSALWTLLGHQNAVYSICTRGNLALTGSSDRTVRLWHIPNLEFPEDAPPGGAAEWANAPGTVRDWSVANLGGTDSVSPTAMGAGGMGTITGGMAAMQGTQLGAP